jgi:hypothetical protein
MTEELQQGAGQRQVNYGVVGGGALQNQFLGPKQVVVAERGLDKRWINRLRDVALALCTGIVLYIVSKIRQR